MIKVLPKDGFKLKDSLNIIWFNMIINYATMISSQSASGFKTWLRRTRDRTYVVITYVSKENNLGPDDKIMFIWALKGPMFIL